MIGRLWQLPQAPARSGANSPSNARWTAVLVNYEMFWRAANVGAGPSSSVFRGDMISIEAVAHDALSACRIGFARSQ
jgi:hypothetical protein